MATHNIFIVIYVVKHNGKHEKKYLALTANDNESNANAILKEINLTESLDNENISINNNGEIVESRAAAVTTPSTPWTIQKETPQINMLKKKTTEG